MTFIVSDLTALAQCEETTSRRNASGAKLRFVSSQRVMHLCRVGYIGGAERILLTLASASAAKGREVFLACPPGPLADEARRNGIKVLRVSFSRMKITANPLKYIEYGVSRRAGAREVLELCREHAIDILHAHHPVTALYCDQALRGTKTKLVLHIHEGPPGRTLYFLALRRAAKLASRIICVSNAGMELMISASVRLDKARIVHNGVRLPEPTGGRAFRRVKTEDIRIAVVGMVEPRKGQDIFIDAIALIAAGGLKLQCHIIGDPPTGGSRKYMQGLMQRVEKLGLQDHITFVPYVPDMIKHMSTYDIVVSSSTGMESLGFVVLEAMTQGCTVVATKVGGIEEVITHGVNGFLAEPRCAHSLRDGICEAIMADRETIGREAKAVREQFSVEAMLAAVAEVYSTLELSRGG